MPWKEAPATRGSESTVCRNCHRCHVSYTRRSAARCRFGRRAGRDHARVITTIGLAADTPGQEPTSTGTPSSPAAVDIQSGPVLVSARTWNEVPPLDYRGCSARERWHELVPARHGAGGGGNLSAARTNPRDRLVPGPGARRSCRLAIALSRPRVRRP